MLINQQSSQPTLLSRRPSEGGGTCIAEQKVLPNSPSVYRGGAHRAGALQAQRVEDLGGSLNRLLDYREADGRYLVTRKVHWQAIFRILVDRGIYPNGTDYRGFCYYMEGMCPVGGYRVPLSYQSLKSISRTMFVRPFTEWRYDAVYGISRQSYERMYRIAATLNKLLDS